MRIINNKTIQHISSHSELWTDVNQNEIKPAKLLTRTYDDNYGIYENLVFCKTVDEILAFARNRLGYLKELIYTHQTIEIDLLERVNHLNYFLALGKLHTGYSRNFDTYYVDSMRCLNKLQYITNTIVPRLKSPVYKNNKSRPKQLRLHKTNILSMHREYHRIYNLSKYFSLNNISCDRQITKSELDALQKNYFNFCLLLCIFSAGHFNFVCDEELPVNLSRPNLDFKFKDWQLNISKSKCGNTPIIRLKIKKDREYVVLLIPSALKDNTELLETIRQTTAAQEYVICTPHEETKDESTLVGMTSLESFRRIQQILLRAMVYADDKRTDCPFCNNKLSLIAEESTPERPVCRCLSCRTEIRLGYCPEMKAKFPFTKIANLSKPRQDGDLWFVNRRKEGQMYFRNITRLDDDMQIVCPLCGKVH